MISKYIFVITSLSKSISLLDYLKMPLTVLEENVIKSDPSAPERQGCCSSVPPGPASREDVFQMHLGTTHTCKAIRTYDRHSEQSHEHSTNSLCSLLALPEEGGGPLLRVRTHTSIFTYRHVQCGSLQQLGSDTHSAQELPLDPSMPSWWYLDIQAPGAAALHRLWTEQRPPLPGKT